MRKNNIIFATYFDFNSYFFTQPRNMKYLKTRFSILALILLLSGGLFLRYSNPGYQKIEKVSIAEDQIEKNTLENVQVKENKSVFTYNFLFNLLHKFAYGELRK